MSAYMDDLVRDEITSSDAYDKITDSIIEKVIDIIYCLDRSIVGETCPVVGSEEEELAVRLLYDMGWAEPTEAADYLCRITEKGRSELNRLRERSDQGWET